MIEFKKGFDLLGSITGFIIRRRQDAGVSDIVAISPRVLTQEKDGAIVYSWADFNPPSNRSGSLVTHIGLLDPASQEHKVVWINNQKLKIVSCSINKAKTLLAFTTFSKPNGRTGKEVYRAFLAEIQASDTRVFSLNLERSNYLKVQFLYPGHSSSSSSRDSHLLVFLHKESVGLYKIPLARVGERGTVMCDQPKTEQIVRKFVWCQWDSVNQRLHYIHNYRTNTDTVNPIIGQKLSTIQFHQNANYDNMFDIPLNFPFPYIKSSSRSHYADRPLNPGIPDVSLNACVLSQPNGTYCLCYQHANLPSGKDRTSPTSTPDEDSSVNYYICMVHHTKTICGCVSGLPKSLIGSRRLSFHWLGDYLMVLLPGFFVHLLNVGIEFEPCHHILLHNHEKGLTYSPLTSSTSFVSSSSDREPDAPQADVSSDAEDSFKLDTRSHTVRFQLVDNTSPSVERSLSQLSLPVRVLNDLPDSMSAISIRCRNIHSLSPCMGFTRELGGTMYDYRNGQVWKVVVSMESAVESFKTAYAQTRQAILHYVLLRTKDMLAIRKIFNDICRDLTKSELAQSMAEYLVASTYSSMKRQLEKEVMRLLPFTATETLRGQFERSPSGARLACLSYTSLDSIYISTKTAKERQTQRAVSEDMWDVLRRRLRLRQLDNPARFSLEAVSNKLSKLVAQEENDRLKWETLVPIRKRREDGFLGSILIRGQRSTPVTELEGSDGRRSRTEMILGPPPAFLQGAYGEDSSKTKRVNLLTEELLTGYLSHHLKKDNKVKAQNVAREYVACQAQKTQQLCHLLWSLRRPELASDSEVIPNLCESGSEEENDLFQLYERLYLILSELCFPTPPGFQTCLTVLGFRCLDFRLFLQYVDRGVLPLTGQFVTQLLADVPDIDRENHEIKYQIISRLPKNLAEECFRTWNQPVSNKYFAHTQVSDILMEGGAPSRGKHDHTAAHKHRARTLIPDNASDTSLSSHATFVPLASFIRHLEDLKGPAQRHGRSATVTSGTADIDTVLLEEVGLQHTKQLSQYDMSTVHF